LIDVVDPAKRSLMMAGIRGKNTKPELTIRRALHALGFRYRLHCKDLPGNPDLCFPRWKAVIFVHGCFWHGHDCHLFRLPSTRPEFWGAKIRRNREVDQRSLDALLAAGWRVAVVWECSLKGKTRLPLAKIVGQCEDWLRGSAASLAIQGNAGE